LGAYDDIEIVGEAGSGEEAITLIGETTPHVVLMDVHMPPGMSGVKATRIVRETYQDVQVVMLSGHQDYVREGIRACSMGYMLKECAPEQMIEAIRNAAHGQRTFDPSVLDRLADSLDGTNQPALTPRELAVLEHIAAGATNIAIAKTLNLSEPMVKKIVGQVFDKLGAANRAEAVRIATQRGLL